MIAVEVHQGSLGSSDLVFGMEFSSTVTHQDAQFNNRQRLLDNLRITEILPDPTGDMPSEFIELHNRGTDALNLNGVRLDGGIRFTFPDIELPAGESIIVAEDPAALLAERGSGVHVVGQYQGNLSNTSEEIILQLPAPDQAAILRFTYETAWYPSTSNEGRSLEIVDADAGFTTWGQKSSWQASAAIGGTPGYPTGPAPTADNIVINEVLSHTDLPLQDAIELHNTGSQPVNLAGWYLSDSGQDPQHFRIPDGTTIAGGQYVVFTEDQFDPSGGTNADGIALDGAHGDSVWLWKPSDSGKASYIVDAIEFGAAATGESFGRFPNGVGELTPMQSVTLGAANSLPRVGPVLISEVQYHPVDPSPEAIRIDPTLIDEDLEFVEIHNPTSERIPMNGWRLAGGIEYAFDAATDLKAGGTLLVVSFDPADPNNVSRLAAFRVQYGLPGTTLIVGGYSGRLSNGGDQVELRRPDEPPVEDPTCTPLLLEDQIRYDDEPPWPTAADGLGSSLSRTLPAELGREASSWTGEAPTPGYVVGSVIPGDFNHDSIVDASDVNLLTAAIRDDTPGYDLTGDGQVNLADHDYMIREILDTTYGDADLDQFFDSSDFVLVFQAGEYEDGANLNSGWEEGDWNADGDFDSSDVVLAFQTGDYETAAAATPPGNLAEGEPPFAQLPIAVPRIDLGHRFLSSSIIQADDSANPRSLDINTTHQAKRRRLDSHAAVDRYWRVEADSWFSSHEEHKLTIEADTIADIASAQLGDPIV